MCHACHVQLLQVTCCSLITALDKGGQWQMAETVFMQVGCGGMGTNKIAMCPRLGCLFVPTCVL